MRPPGWRPSSETAALQNLPDWTGGGPRPFNKQKLAERQKAYFQCLLALPSLFGKGLTDFAHSEKASYYMQMLRTQDPSSVLPGRPAKAFQSALKDLPDDQALLALTDQVVGGADPSGSGDYDMLAICCEEDSDGGGLEGQLAAENEAPLDGMLWQPLVAVSRATGA